MKCLKNVLLAVDRKGFCEGDAVQNSLCRKEECFIFPQYEEGDFEAFQEYLSKTKLSCEFIGYHRNGEQVAVILKRPVSCAGVVDSGSVH